MRGNTVTIEVSLKRGKMAKSVPLYQYDYGQKLIFTNVELPDVYEVHFSNEMYGRAVTMIGDSTGVFIPDEMLVSGSPVYLWLFLHDGADDGETEYTGVIPIIQRAKPDDEEPTPEQQSVITQAIAALNNGVQIVESIAGDVTGALEAALEEAKESGEFDGADGRDGVDGQDGADGYTPQKGVDYNDGADGFSPVVSISTIDGGHRMTVEDAQGTQSVDIMDGAKGDKGDTGSVENVFASTVPMSPDDDTTILNAMGDKISKLTNATSGNFASFDANGGIEDSGHSHSDYLTQHQDISGKVDVTDFFATEMPMSDQDATTVSNAISSNSTAITNINSKIANVINVGLFTASGSGAETKITDSISKVTTGGDTVSFTANPSSSGTAYVSGFLYPDKDYGGGYYIDTYRDAYWYLSSGTLTVTYLTYSTINVNSYSTYVSIYNVLDNNPSLIAVGGIGNQDNTSLKTILPNPTGFANYTSVSIKKIGLYTMIVTARQLYGQKIAVCYISFGDTGNWYRTDWEIKTTAS